MKKFVPQSKEELLLLGNLHIASRAIHFFAQYPIADYLLDKPRSVQEIASHFSFEEEALHKLLRILASFNILEENDPIFSLTELGKYLCHNHSQSIKDFLFWDETRWTPLGKLEETLKTMLPAFSKIYGEEYFDYLSKRPDLQKSFDQHMQAVSFEEDQILAEALPLKEHSHFIDIGGGKGGLVKAILSKKTAVRASLLDLPEAINASAPLQREYPDRVTCIKGSFFEPIQASCNAVILKRVLHDWNDDQCIQILHQAQNALKPNSEIFIVENVLKGKNDSTLTRLFDLFLLNLLGGRERSLEDYKNLIARAGLKFSRCIETFSPMSIIVARFH